MVCRRFGLSPFRFVTVSVCRRFDCRRFDCRSFGSFKMNVAVMVCRRFGLSPFRLFAVSASRRFRSFKMDVAVMVCRRSGLSPFQPVADSVCRRFDSPPLHHYSCSTTNVRCAYFMRCIEKSKMVAFERDWIRNNIYLGLWTRWRRTDAIE